MRHYSNKLKSKIETLIKKYIAYLVCGNFFGFSYDQLSWALGRIFGCSSLTSLPQTISLAFGNICSMVVVRIGMQDLFVVKGCCQLSFAVLCSTLPVLRRLVFQLSIGTYSRLMWSSAFPWLLCQTPSPWCTNAKNENRFQRWLFRLI